MYLTIIERKMLETTLINLQSSIKCAGNSADGLSDISEMTDSELETTLNHFLADL